MWRLPRTCIHHEAHSVLTVNPSTSTSSHVQLLYLAPDGNVAKGSIRKYTDNDTVRQIKESIDRLEECQYTLINYKKSGEVRHLKNDSPHFACLSEYTQ